MGIQVKDPRREILARIFNKINLTVFACFFLLCGYFSDLLRFKRFPLTPSFHSKRKDLSLSGIGNQTGLQNFI